jgi:hypothetical protein
MVGYSMGYEFSGIHAKFENALDAEEGSSDRRDGPRLVTVYCVARVLARGDQGLARVLNLSDDGMMLSLRLDLFLGDEVTVDLSEACSLTGNAVWRQGDWCGLKLIERIDTPALLKRLRDERRAPGARQLRLPIEKRILASSELGIQIVRLRDVSQRGAKVVHDGRFRPGLAVRLHINPQIQRRGVVRWSQDGIAGIQLTELLSVDDLGSVNLL